MDLSVIIGLAILLIISNTLWCWNTHLLLNKMMSRTYWEFQQAKQIPKTTEAELKESLANIKIPENRGPNDLDSLD